MQPFRLGIEETSTIGSSSSSVPAFPRTTSTKTSDVNLNREEKVGMIIGGILLLTIIAVFLFCVRRRIQAGKRNKVAMVKIFCCFIFHF